MIKIENIDAGFEIAKREEHYTMFFQNQTSKQYVISRYTPREDALLNIGEDKGNKQTVWIIVGFALGYIVKELLDTISEDLTIIVIEPSEELLDAQMKYEGNEELKQKKNVHFLVGDINAKFRDKLNCCIPNSEINNIKVICMNVYVKFYFKYCEEIKQAIEDTIFSRVIDMNTVQKYNVLYTANVIKNRYHIEKSYRLEPLKNAYKDIPAVVVSAGPSLYKSIEYIKDFNGLILVGNRTVAPVIEQGKVPDYMFVADPEDIVFDTTRGKMREDIPLIANDNANNKIIEAHQGKKYFIKTNSGVEELLGVENVGRLSMGGSVATLCASAAQYMGCNPIILIGQDCAYTDMKIYADDCANTLFSDEMRNDSSFSEFTKVWIDEYYGGKVMSSPDLVYFARWFEKFAESNPDITLIDATEGGALIRGAVNQPFKEVVRQYQTSKYEHAPIEDKHVGLKEPVDDQLQKVKDKLEEIIRNAKKAKGLSQQLKAEYVMYKGTREDKISELVKKLDKLDAKIKKQKEATEPMRVIFNSVYNKTQTVLTNKAKIDETEQEAGIRVAIESYNLYHGIIEASKNFIEILEEK